MSQSSRSFQMLSEVTIQQILVQAMNSKVTIWCRELDYSSNVHFSIVYVVLEATKTASISKYFPGGHAPNSPPPLFWVHYRKCEISPTLLKNPVLIPDYKVPYSVLIVCIVWTYSSSGIISCLFTPWRKRSRDSDGFLSTQMVCMSYIMYVWLAIDPIRWLACHLS